MLQAATIAEKFAGVCARFADKPALVPGDGEPMTYAQLESLAARFAAALQARGVEPGDRVMVQADKSAGYVALYFGCQRAGAVFLPLNTAYTPAEVAFFAEDARPALFVNDSGTSDLDVATVSLGAPDAGLWAEALGAKEAAMVARSGDDVAAICYTSGTTGRSKGAMITQANLVSNAETLIDLWQFTEADMLLHILPVFHVHGLFVALHCALLSGATVLFETGFAIDRVLALLPKATVMMGVPTHYTRLLDDDGFGGDVTASMRLFLSGSAPLLAETHRAFEARTGLRILERYGMTEAGMITSNPYDGERVAGTVGYPLPGVEGRVRSADGSDCAAGEIGVLQIRGPNVFAGYWELPEQTAEAFTADGWMVTGDLVSADETGRITIEGRAKDLIISGGYNVYPKEIEVVIDAIPGVKESAVIGVPHRDFGEAVAAVVVPEPGAELTAEAVQAQVAEKLARFKHPRAIHFVDALPRNTMGKVQKAELRKQYGDS